MGTAKLILIASLLLGVGGCSFSGYGGTTKFRCTNQMRASNDPYCNSVTSNYNASVSGVLLEDGSYAYSNQDAYESNSGVNTLRRMATLDSGTPVRSQSEVARIWIAPYLDTDDDLVDQSYTYVVLNQGKWQIEHNQQNIIDQYRPVRLLGSNNQAQPTSDAKTAKAQSGRSLPGSITNLNDSIPDVGQSLNLQAVAPPPSDGNQ